MRTDAPRLLALSCCCILDLACSERSTPAPGPAAASVEGRVPESELPRVKLPEATERRLGIERVPVMLGTLHRTNSYSGEVVASPDGEVVLRAPVGGTVRAASSWPRAGERASAPFLRLEPRLSVDRDHPSKAERATLEEQVLTRATARAAASGALAQARARVAAARTTLQRAEELLASGADSVQARDDARLALALAEQDEVAATTTLALHDGIATPGGFGAVGGAAPLPIGGAGTFEVVQVHVIEGQEVAAGEPLVTLASIERWIAVQLPVSERRGLDLALPAEVRPLSAPAGAPPTALAPPIAGPPRASAAGAATTRWFALPPAAAGAFDLGERVAVRLARGELEELATVPASALVRDAEGGTWVYVRVAVGSYQRVRVEVRAIEAEVAFLGRAPAVGSEVVAVGVAELFGVEFGAGK